MENKMKSIRVLDPDFNIIGEIDNYSSFTFTKRFYKSAGFDLSVPLTKDNLRMLKEGNIIIFSKNSRQKTSKPELVGIIEYVEFNAFSNNVLNIKGINLAGLLTRRIIVPNGSDLYLSFTGKQETIIKSFIDKCMVNANDTKRNINNFMIAEDKGRGSDDKWRSAYENLETKISEICTYAKLGFDVQLDLAERKFIFDIIEGRDLTIEQDINPPVLFSQKFDNIKSRTYTESMTNSKNYVYAGQSEEEGKMVLGYGSGEGMNRWETFESCNEDSVEAIKKFAETRLEELKKLETFEQEVYPEKNFIYGTDYRLGDTVTLLDTEMDIQINRQITEITETHTPTTESLEIVFGDIIPSIADKLKKL